MAEASGVSKLVAAISFVSLFLFVLVGGVITAVDLSGTSPEVAKGFAANNSLDGFTDWLFPDYGHYASEYWQELDSLGRPMSLINFTGTVAPIPADIKEGA